MGRVIFYFEAYLKIHLIHDSMHLVIFLLRITNFHLYLLPHLSDLNFDLMVYAFLSKITSCRNILPLIYLCLWATAASRRFEHGSGKWFVPSRLSRSASCQRLNRRRGSVYVLWLVLSCYMYKSSTFATTAPLPLETGLSPEQSMTCIHLFLP